MKGDVSMGAFLTGVTEADIQKQRDQILGATKEDIRKLSDIVQAILDCGNLCVIGSENKIEQNKDLFLEVKNLSK
ncbi:hypothetical protein D3C75_1011860 [compost metagenome]